jgi:phosphate butyryltransferase
MSEKKKTFLLLNKFGQTNSGGLNMSLKTLADVAALVKRAAEKKTVVLVQAADAHSLEAVLRVKKEGLLDFLLTGVRRDIMETAEKIGAEVSDAQIIDARTAEEAALKGVELIRNGTAHFLMKGKLETSELLRPVINRETGISGGRTMSHIALNEIPSYHKLLITTDGGMLPYPSLEQKKDIIENAAGVMRSLGIQVPKVCVLAAVEKLNVKMPETVGAAALKEMYLFGKIANCIVEGPISLDLALVKERAAVKGYESPCAGDADILVVPNIHAGNILGKSLVEMAGAKMAGLVIGAKCPVVLTSRGSSGEEKYYSLVLACAVCG